MLADLLVLAKSTYGRREILGLDKEMQDDAVRRLHNHGAVLSVSALGSVVGVSPYRVKKAIGLPLPEARGHLNPQHISMLLFALSLGDLPPRWVEEMLTGGTSASTITDLTGISESTIYRRKP